MSTTKENPTKSRLKTMAKNSHTYGLRTTSRILKYGASGYKRNIWLSIAATLVMTFTLLVLLAATGVYSVLNATANSMKDSIDITIYFRPGTELSKLNQMANIMLSDDNVESVTVATSEDNYEAFMRDERNTTTDEGDKLTILDDEDMRDAIIKSMKASMTVKPIDPDDLSSIKHIVETDPDFISNLDPKRKPSYENQTNKDVIDNITSWANKITIAGLGLGIVFIVISILVIFNTVRMAIFSRREEIYMEKLLGASNHFIRGPFLVEAMMSGVLAGVLSGILSIVAFNILGPRLTTYGIDVSIIKEYLSSYKLALIFCVAIFVGSFIGLLSARLAIRKYLK